MSPSRCAYEYETSAVEDHGAACCWRPVWDDRDRCLWHTNEAEKPRELLEAARPSPGERLDGAILRGVSLSNVTWLRDCVLIGADFSGASLAGVDFTGADLKRSTFRDVDAHGASFVRTDLEDAIFVFTDLRGARFTETRLYRAVFTDVRVNQETDFGSHVIYEDELTGGDGVSDARTSVESATWTYREIERVFEENANPSRARHYFLREMDLRRRAAWRERDVLEILQSE